MFAFFYLTFIFSKMLVIVKPDSPVLIDFPLTEDLSDFSISLTNLDQKIPVKYEMFKNMQGDDYDIKTFKTLERDFSKQYSEQGLYTLVLYNIGKEDCLISLQSFNNKVMGNEDKDVKALKSLFNEIESRLGKLYDLYLELKRIQEVNIKGASRIVKGLYIMLVIPMVYILVGFGKIKAVKMMFAPKKGIKP